MIRVLDVAAAFLAMISAALAFVAYQVGEQGEQAARERLAGTEAMLATVGLSGVVQKAAGWTDGSVNDLLGARVWSWKAVWRWFIVAELVGIPVGLWVVQLFYHGLGGLGPWYALTCFGIVALSFPFDFVFLAYSRELFRRIESSKGANPGLLYIVYVYVAYALACFIALGIVSAFGATKLSLSNIILRGLEWPYVVWSQPPVLLLVLPLTLSTLLFGTVIIGALLMRQSRGLTEPLALWLIKRVASAKKGTFGKLTALLLLISTILTFFLKL